MPEEVVETLSAAIASIMANPEFLATAEQTAQPVNYIPREDYVAILERAKVIHQELWDAKPWREKFPQFNDTTGKYGGSVVKNPVANFAAMALGGGRITLDTSSPLVNSIAPATLGPTNADSIEFTVNFSESVSGFDPSGVLVVHHQDQFTRTTSTGVEPTRIIRSAVVPTKALRMGSRRCGPMTMTSAPSSKAASGIASWASPRFAMTSAVTPCARAASAISVRCASAAWL